MPEAYTLGIAVIALVTGWIELRWHPELTSWVSYGIALAAALGPSLVIVIATDRTTLRLVLLLIGATAVLHRRLDHADSRPRRSSAASLCSAPRST